MVRGESPARRIDRFAMAPPGFSKQAREFRLAFERLERGLPIEVREARQTLINGASKGRERHRLLFHPGAEQPV